MSRLVFRCLRQGKWRFAWILMFRKSQIVSAHITESGGSG